MKLGIKVSLQSESIPNIRTAHPSAAEVWFDISREHEYTELFQTLKDEGVETGLHFWGALPDGTMANIAYPDTELNNASLALMKRAIEIAASHKFVYVNIHPTQNARIKVSFKDMNYPAISKPADIEQAIQLFLSHASDLTQYATSRNVVFTVETVSRLSPSTDWYNPESRLHPANIYDLPIRALELAVQNNIYVANDFVHTATHCLSPNRKEIWDYLFSKTQLLAPQTQLIHLGFLVPPFNGVDNHDMLDNPIFRTNNAIPNRNEMIELLRLFKNKNVWIIPEPRSDHVKNFFEAKKMLSEL